MSKSRGNVVSPDDLVASYGADAVRAYLMFIGPWEQGGEWNDNGLVGISRWLNRVWNLVLEQAAIKDEKDLRRQTHKTIKKVHEDLDQLKFNTMLAALMEFTNYLAKVKEVSAVSGNTAWQEAIESLVLLLAPTAPHLAEELWEGTEHPYSIHNQSFPAWQDELAAEDMFTLVIQINGKLRDKIDVPVSISEAEAKDLALEREKILSQLDGKTPAKVVYVAGRLVNIVVK